MTTQQMSGHSGGKIDTQIMIWWKNKQQTPFFNSDIDSISTFLCKTAFVYGSGTCGLLRSQIFTADKQTERQANRNGERTNRGTDKHTIFPYKNLSKYLATFELYV